MLLVRGAYRRLTAPHVSPRVQRRGDGERYHDAHPRNHCKSTYCGGDDAQRVFRHCRPVVCVDLHFASQGGAGGVVHEDCGQAGRQHRALSHVAAALGRTTAAAPARCESRQPCSARPTSRSVPCISVESSTCSSSGGRGSSRGGQQVNSPHTGIGHHAPFLRMRAHVDLRRLRVLGRRGGPGRQG